MNPKFTKSGKNKLVFRFILAVYLRKNIRHVISKGRREQFIEQN